MKNNQVVEVKKVGDNGHKTNWLQILKNHFTDLKGAGWTDENLTTIDGLVDDLITAVGAIEGATTLHNKLTAARAGYLDELVAGGDMHDALIADAAGANIAADIIALKAETALIVADTNEVQVSLADGGFTDLLIDAILADTDELQGDWADGGRLDLLLDAIKAITDTLTLAALEAEAVDALESFDLDHLMAVVMGAALDTIVLDDTVLGFILAKADVSTFDRTTDSLEAISEAIAGIAGVNTYMEQIPDTDFALAAIDNALTVDPPTADAENSVVDIDQNAGDTFVLRSLWVNITDFGTAGTKLTFGLWVLVNGVVTQVDSVDVTALGIQNLMDLFGLQEVHADGIWITVLTDSGSADAACSGTWKYAKAT